MIDAQKIGLPRGASLAQYMAARWGVKTRLVPQQTVAVLASATRILKNNPRRFGLTIINQGTGQVFLDWSAGVAVGVGVILTALGGSLTLVPDEDGEIIGYDMWAIASAAGNNLSIWETEAI
jgi:hypothetical protein